MQNSQRERALVVGCGQLGSRHLQALCALPELTEIDIVDANPAALDLAKTRLLEVPASANKEIRSFSSIEEVENGGALCIVATQSPDRLNIMRSIFEKLNYKHFLVEKIVTQSVEDYLELLKIQARKELKIWVNCKARAHLSHKRIKKMLDPSDPVQLVVMGGNHGLANNGIHAADLFVFFDNAKKIECTGEQIDPILHPSKRGSEMVDLSGTLYGASSRGGQFMLSFSGDHMSPAQFSVSTKKYRAIVDDAMKFFYESTEESGWVWTRVPFEANLMVSNMTTEFAKDILAKGTCELPTLEECFPAHQFILQSLKPHFSRLLKRDIEYCPVT